MQAQDNAPDLATNDLGPLAWVLDELRKSLESASAALRRFVRDAGLARGTDMASVDDGQLRIARQQLHQSVGALEMVGMQAPAHMLRAMEAAVQKFVERPELCSEAAAAKVERAGFALTEYLEGVLLGKPATSIALFPQYRDVQELAGADRVHPADLWTLSWRWIEPQTPAVVDAFVYEPVLRARMDQAVLRVVKSGDAASAQEMANTCLALAATQSARQPKIFWKICAGFFEAMRLGLLPLDIYVKRAGSRVLMQYATLAKGELSVSDRLAQDLLFFCAQAVPARAADAPALAGVRLAYGLANYVPVDYLTPQFGRFDPVLLAQARKRIGVAKETWSALSGGDANKLKGLGEQFSLVCDSLVKLHPPSAPLAQSLAHVTDSLVRGGQAPRTEMAMEVATAVLYLEAAFQDLDPTDSELAQRTAHLAQRLDKVREGGQPEALEPWMEELYRRVSDRQTMGSVVGELRGTLSELEKVLDAFFRNPQDKTPLQGAPAHLTQMRGVLSVLGLDQASQAVLRMRDSLEEMIVTEVDEQRARTAGTFDKLGNNLGALGFLIDMLNYQPTLAKKLFVYDDVSGELRPLMGRTGVAHEPPAEAVAQAAESIVPVENSVTHVAPVAVAAPVFVAPTSAVVSPNVTADAPMSLAVDPVAAAAVDATVIAAPAPVAKPVAVPPVPAATAADDGEEDELLDIFLEEAREVVQTGLAAIETLAANPGDASELTTLRRAFHTLKGSSRMVGLTEFGDAGWSMEQVLNTWLADQKQSTEELRTLSADAMRAFGRWADDIAAKQDGEWKSSMISVAADALRLQGRLLPIALPGAAVAAAAPSEIVAVPEFEANSAEPVAVPTVVAATVLADVPAEFADILELPPTLELAPTNPAPAAFVDSLESQPTFELAPADVHHAIDFEIAAPAPESSAAAPDFDFTAPASPSAESPVVPAATESDADLLALFDAAAPMADAAPESTALDFPTTQEIAAFHDTLSFDTTQVIRAEPVSAAELAAEEVAADFDFDLSIDPVVSAAPEPVVVTEVESIDFGSLSGLGEPAPTAADMTPPQESEDAALHPAAADEQIKVIGSLRIGIPLYNVYLNEADEWSRRLATEVGEWALELNRPVPDSAVGLAHALGGSSATVGFHTLSEIARALEHSLQDTQLLAYGTPQHGQAFVAAAEEIRRLLHQFAAGFLKESDARVLQALADLEHLDVPKRADLPEPDPFEIDAVERVDSGFDVVDAIAEDAMVSDSAQQPEASGEAVTASSTVDSSTLHPGAPIESADSLELVVPAEPVEVHSQTVTPITLLSVVPSSPMPATVAAPQQSTTLIAPSAPVAPSAHRPMAVSGALHEDEEEIDVTDAVDVDLFPIFEEEAIELMPQLGSALRQWAARPDNRGARDEVLRALHTLKGSARLAGALRLGELAHRVESEIEALGSDNQNAADIEPLLHRFDNLQASFDALRTGVGQETAALDAPVVELPSPQSVDNTAAIEPATASADAPDPIAAVPTRALLARPVTTQLAPQRAAANQAVRVRSQLLDRLVNQAGEVMITRSRLEVELRQLRSSLTDLTGNLDRLRSQLRDIELHSETQMQSRLAQAKDSAAGFDPLEFDRFTRVQELTRMMAESVNDVATVQRNLQRTVEATEDDLIAQGRQTRELQRDLLRTRMVEFEGISDRLYRVVRLASKETGKQVKLDITGGSIEMDRGVLDRMTPAFEHLLRNCVAHGIEDPASRTAHGKDAAGTILIHLHQEGNDVSVEFRDDGAGLNLPRIREKALQQGMITPQQEITDAEAANLIFMPGFSTAAQVTELSGRGIGMDVVRSEVNALGGRIETQTQPGQGTSFKLVLPLTTAVTQVVMIRTGNLAIGVPANLIEVVRRAPAKEVQQAYNSGSYEIGGEQLAFYWSGALLQASQRSNEPQGKTLPIVVFRSANQRIAVHVDEVLGNQEVVVKNLGPQLSRLPGLAGMTVLASGAVVLIYNPVALTAVYGEQARRLSADHAQPDVLEQTGAAAGTTLPVVPVIAAVPQVPLVLVVDDSITVRRVTQRLLQREGYRVALAADGLQALERLAEERPAVVLSDIEMPRMDGFDLARNIRADDRLAGLPIIMITSRIAGKHREHAMELGVNHYLGKPYSEEELLSLVKHYGSVAVATA